METSGGGSGHRAEHGERSRDRGGAYAELFAGLILEVAHRYRLLLRNHARAFPVAIDVDALADAQVRISRLRDLD